MKTLARCRLVLFIALVTACSDSSLLGPASSDNTTSASAAVSERLTVMTRNLYIGNDVDLVIAALASPSPFDDLPALQAGIQVLQRTDFPTRALALAGEIARARPHIIGLQEVEDLQIDLSALGFPIAIQQNFLALLLAALADRGLDYVEAARVKNIDATPFPGIRLTDHDVVLIDRGRGVTSTTVAAQRYTNNVGPVAPGVELVRGFVVIDASVPGRQPVRVADTHLESGAIAGLSNLRAAQALELLAFVGTASPAVLLGDFNDGPGSPMHQVVTGAGFSDVWEAMRPGARGLTCCHIEDLSNQVSVLDQRIDYVFARGLAGSNGKLQGKVTIIGDQPGNRVPGPAYRIWPSDHAGLVAQFLETPAQTLALAP